MAEDEEELDTKMASENASRRFGIGTNFYGRIYWSNLELDSLIEPQEEVRENRDKTEDQKMQQLESMLAEKDRLIDTMKKDLNDLESSNAQTEKSLAESETVIEQLKASIQRQKDSEKRLFDSFVMQTSQFEQAMIFIDSWKEKMASVKERTGITSYEENYWLRLQVERLENELQIQRNGQNPWDEVMRLRKELEQAIEGEDNKKRAMDDLAAVIKEVASEANQTKEKVISTEQQLQNAKEEIENLKSMIGFKEKAHQLALKEAKIAEEKNWVTLGAAKKENESLKGTINRLKIIVKEQLPSLNGKDNEFIDSIKKEEDEKVNMQEEKNRLLELLNEAKDESQKLRYILQQAKVEITQLKDALAEKENTIVALTLETEKLKTNEATTDHNMKELNRQITSHSRKDSKSEEKDKKKKKKDSSSEKNLKGGIKLIGDLKGSWKSTGDLKAKDSMSEEKEKNNNNNNKKKEIYSEKDSKDDGKQNGDLKGSWKSIVDLKSSVKSTGLFCSIPLSVPGISKHKGVEELPKTDEDLTDSIFDLVEPDSGKHQHTRSASAVTFTEDERSVISEDFDEPHDDNIEIEKRSHRKRKVLLRKISGLWKRKNHNPSHSHSHSHSHSNNHSHSHNGSQ